MQNTHQTGISRKLATSRQRGRFDRRIGHKRIPSGTQKGYSWWAEDNSTKLRARKKNRFAFGTRSPTPRMLSPDSLSCWPPAALLFTSVSTSANPVPPDIRGRLISFYTKVFLPTVDRSPRKHVFLVADFRYHDHVLFWLLISPTAFVKAGHRKSK